MHAVYRLSIIATAGALLLAVAGCQTFQQPEWPLPPGVKTLTVNGYPMAYVERGSGPTLVLVPGSLNDYRYWTPQLETLSSRFRVVAVSPRHYFPERWNGKGTSFGLEQHAQDLAAFIAGLNAGPIYLVGWSRGGHIAVRTALARPELVSKLVLMDAGLAELVPATGSGKPPPGGGKLAIGAEEFFKKGDLDGGLQYFFDGVNGVGAWQKLPEEQRRFRVDNAWTLVGQAADANAKPVTCAEVGGLKMPVLYMTGDKSPPQYKPIFDALQRCQPAGDTRGHPEGNAPDEPEQSAGCQFGTYQVLSGVTSEQCGYVLSHDSTLVQSSQHKDRHYKQSSVGPEKKAMLHAPSPSGNESIDNADLEFCFHCGESPKGNVKRCPSCGESLL